MATWWKKLDATLRIEGANDKLEAQQHPNQIVQFTVVCAAASDRCILATNRA